jgi:hypothetical protein
MIVTEDTIEYFHMPDWHMRDETSTPRRFLSVGG